LDRVNTKNILPCVVFVQLAISTFKPHFSNIKK